MILDSYFERDCAAVITARTPRAERADLIQRFRHGDGIRFLCNVGVLATGFDAPTADAVCLTRPTMSAIRYEQMGGRGLRDPKNGGTERCTVLDVQDRRDLMEYRATVEFSSSGMDARLGRHRSKQALHAVVQIPAEYVSFEPQGSYYRSP